MATLDSINELFEVLKEHMNGSEEAKVAYAAGYFKGLMSSYVPQETIDWHINHLKEFA